MKVDYPLRVGTMRTFLGLPETLPIYTINKTCDTNTLQRSRVRIDMTLEADAHP